MGKTATQKQNDNGAQFDNAGLPTRNGWKNVKLEGATDTATYALEITGDSMLPVYRQGDVIVVSPGATVRNGDRVVVRTSDKQVMARILQKKTSRTIELAAFNPAHPVKTFDAKNIDWMARIIWASQ